MGIEVLCGTGIYANEVACEIDNYISDFVSKAVASESALDTALTSLTNAYDTNITPVDYGAVSPSLTTTVNKTFAAPTVTPARGNYASEEPALDPVRGDYESLQPTVISIPDKDALLADVDWDAIYARARSRIARSTAAKYRQDINDTGSMGLGLSSPAITAATREATQAQNDGVIVAALEQAAAEAEAELDASKFVVDKDIQNYSATWQVTQGRLGAEEETYRSQLEDLKTTWDVTRTRLAAEEETFRSQIQNFLAQVQREGERRGWSQMEINDILQQAKDNAETNIAWGRITLDKLMQVEQIIIQMKAAVFQTWLQAADLGLTFQGSQSVSGN